MTREEPAADRPAEAGGTCVRLRGVSLSVGERHLLHRVDAEFAAGEITLIVGCSGVGKSLLLKFLAGLLDPEGEVQTQGDVLFNDRPLARSRREVGVVFQNFALFDELSPAGNVRFAAAHRSPSKDSPRTDAAADALLDELSVPRDVRTSALSGGQRQRLAIARALAYQPGVLLYDEPTSGLDAVTARRVAGLIARTHASHPQTSIVVTHDYEALAPIADRIYLLDPRSEALIEIPREEWERLGEKLAPPVPRERIAVEGGGPSSEGGARGVAASRAAVRAGRAAATRVADWLRGTSRAAEAALAAAWNLLPIWKSPAWGLRFLAHYLRLVAGPSAWLYIGVSGLIIGFVTTYFTFRFLPYARYTEPLLIEDLLRSMGFALYRILVPVLTTILVAARCGAAVASDVGGKTYGQQVDAIRSFGVAPRRYLLTNILYAFLGGMPLLLLIGYAAAAATSLVVFTSSYPDYGPDFWHLHFHNRLIVPGQWLYEGTGWLLSKTLLCALGIALIAYYRGAAPKSSSQDVSQSVTATILWATLYVLVVHFAFAFYEFEKP